MTRPHFTDDFKIDAVKQITERGYSVADVSKRLGVSTHSLYAWMKRFSKPPTVVEETVEQAAENRRLKQELLRVTEERDILKKATGILREGCKVRYAFIEEHRPIFSVRAMCGGLRVHPSGFYAWLKSSFSKRAIEDERQIALIKEAWEDSGKVYGYRKLHDDLCDQGETCCPNRVARLARLAGIKAQIGYKRRPGKHGGKPSVVVNNTLDRQFNVDAPDRFWVTDITYIKTTSRYLLRNYLPVNV